MRRLESNRDPNCSKTLFSWFAGLSSGSLTESQESSSLARTTLAPFTLQGSWVRTHRVPWGMWPTLSISRDSAITFWDRAAMGLMTSAARRVCS